MRVITIEQDDKEVRNIGTLYEDHKLFFRAIRGSEHFYKHPEKGICIGVDAEVYTNLIKLEAEKIRVLDKETNCLYIITIEVFEQNKFFYHFKPHRAQAFCPLELWFVERGKAKPKKQKHPLPKPYGVR